MVKSRGTNENFNTFTAETVIRPKWMQQQQEKSDFPIAHVNLFPFELMQLNGPLILHAHTEEEEMAH